MPRKLPPFAAVRAFEAAARHCNMQSAAAELLISPSAVSHQVKALENYLGARLFERQNNRLILTEIGEAYLGELSEALDLIEAATANTISTRDRRPVTLNIYSSMAELWLLPHLNSFHEAYPDIQVSLVTEDDDIDIVNSEIDMAIRYTDAPPEDYRCDLLFEEEIGVVCAPELLNGESPVTQLEDILNHRLVVHNHHPDEWELFFRLHNMPEANPKLWLGLDGRHLVLAAAKEKLGFAIHRRPYADSTVEEGSLIEPWPDLRVRTGFSYYLVSPPRTRGIKRVDFFRRWLLELCAKSFPRLRGAA